MMVLITHAGLMIVELLVIAREILSPHRDPASRIAWVVVIEVLPVAGVVAYLLFGKTSIGRPRAARARQVLARLPPHAPLSAETDPRVRLEVPERYEPLFRLGETINGLRPVGGNRARLMEDSNAAIEGIVTDMHAARGHIHLVFHIRLADRYGLRLVEALKRAAAPGVAWCAMANGLGSRAMSGSRHWQEMPVAGVRVTLPCRSETRCSAICGEGSNSAITARSS